MNNKLERKSDDRGDLIEVFKFSDLGQVFYVKTKPGKVRGGHYHKRKIEQFCVIEGKAELRLRDINSNKIEKIIMDGENPEIVLIPINYIHDIKNIGGKDMLLLVWVNEVFNPDDPDTYNEKI